MPLFPGYCAEKRGGTIRHRVRVKGQKGKKITLPVGPDHEDFSQHYHAARRGHKLDARRAATEAPAMSMDKLVQTYLAMLAKDVQHGTAQPPTLKQRRNLLERVCDMPDPDGDRIGALHCDLPPEAMGHIISQWGIATAQADNSMKALRAAYKRCAWLPHNPAEGIAKVHRSRGGAQPWTPEDVRAFLAVHEPGTAANIWLMLGLFTGARVDDLPRLGRKNEVQRDGMTWLRFQPRKANSVPVEVPVAEQLRKALRASKVIGPAYILNSRGEPFKNGASLAERVRKWTAAAGLERKSSHGLRKALGGLLADAGASQHQIMAVHGHTKPQTSEIYTRSAQRARLASDAMAAISGLDFG